MADITNSDFPLPKDAYIAFDGLTVKEKIKQRLSQTGVFTDQNFEGSNLAAVNDVVAMVFSLLFYTLNRNINEKYSTAQIYENMNRIVKQLDYKPIGHQTATLAFGMSAQNSSAGIYTIPRYTGLNINGITYSFAQDVSFVKKEDSVLEAIDSVGNNEILYQGPYIEFPTYNASGNDNEIVYLTVDDRDIIDNFNIDVYVRQDEKWSKWTKTTSLYLHTTNDTVYELRFNENKRYEIKFGNGINGKKLELGDSVGVYYVKSDGKSGEIAANSLLGKRATVFNTIRFNQIITDTSISNTAYLNNTNGLQNLVFNNLCVSSNYSEPETVEQIRANAASTFRAQYSLTTANSYETFIRTNFANIIQDVKVKNNTDFLDSYIKYFYELNLTNPQLESRALFNQLKMADSCNFNNVYAFVVPKTIGNNLGYLYPSQKSIIVNSIQEQKTLTSEIVVSDPVYLAIDLAVSDSNTVLISDIANTELFVQLEPFSKRNPTSVIDDINTEINNYFNRNNMKLGQVINITELTDNILNIDGIKKIFTRTIDTGHTVEGFRFLMWNPVFGDISSVTMAGNVTLEDFQFPYLYNPDFRDRIVVDNTMAKFQTSVI